MFACALGLIFTVIGLAPCSVARKGCMTISSLSGEQGSFPGKGQGDTVEWKGDELHLLLPGEWGDQWEHSVKGLLLTLWWECLMLLKKLPCLYLLLDRGTFQGAFGIRICHLRENRLCCPGELGLCYHSWNDELFGVSCIRWCNGAGHCSYSIPCHRLGSCSRVGVAASEPFGVGSEGVLMDGRSQKMPLLGG